MENKRSEKIFYYSVNNECMEPYYNSLSYMNEYTASYAILEELKARYPSADNIIVCDKYGKVLCSYIRLNERGEE